LAHQLWISTKIIVYGSLQHHTVEGEACGTERERSTCRHLATRIVIQPGTVICHVT